MVFGGGRQVNFRVDLAELVRDDEFGVGSESSPTGVPPELNFPTMMQIVQKTNDAQKTVEDRRRRSKMRSQFMRNENSDGNDQDAKWTPGTDEEEAQTLAFATTISAVITPTIHVPPPSLFLPIVVTDLGLAIEIPRPPPNVLYQYVLAHELFEEQRIAHQRDKMKAEAAATGKPTPREKSLIFNQGRSTTPRIPQTMITAFPCLLSHFPTWRLSASPAACGTFPLRLTSGRWAACCT